MRYEADLFQYEVSRQLTQNELQRIEKQFNDRTTLKKNKDDFAYELKFSRDDDARNVKILKAIYSFTSVALFQDLLDLKQKEVLINQ